MANRISLALSQLVKLIRQTPPPSTHQPYPRLRNFIHDVMSEGRRKNTINLLLETEVTPMQGHLARYKEATGERISLTTYIVKSFACAIDADRSMHAYRHGSSKLVVFDDIDVAVMVERDIDGGSLPVACIVRSVNRKSSGDIHRELKTARSTPLREHGPMSALETQFFELPSVLRKIIWFFIRRDPCLFKQVAGTVGVTSIGMHASGPMVLIPITPMTLTLSIGSISKRAALDNGVAKEHETIQMNLSADHDIIDGAPLMRFAERFKTILHCGLAVGEHRANAE